MSSLIFYHVPEDNEDQEKFNAFIVYKDLDALRLNDIVENFPLPGNYYFRFKFKFENKNCWIDFNNPDAKLPRFDNKVIIKASRIAWTNDQPITSNNFQDLI
jgi:hypothetical protein